MKVFCWMVLLATVCPIGSMQKRAYGILFMDELNFGHRLKLMTGAEYATMHDCANDGCEFEGWTYLGGVRVFF